MARSFLARQVSDLCVGKPPLRSLPATATVSDAIAALKRSGDLNVSIWSYNHSEARCIGKICMVDVIVHICKEDNLSKALQSTVLDLIPKVLGQIQRLDSNSSLLEAIDYILDGAQNLVIPIETETRYNQRKKHLAKLNPRGNTTTLHNGKEFCWLTGEDVIRFLLDSVSVFSLIPTFTIESLNLINTETLTVHYDDPASSALPLITRSHLNQTSIAVVNQDKTLIGEISPFALSFCDESISAAIITLSAGDLMSYLDYSGPPDDLVHSVKIRLQERNLTDMLDLMDNYHNNSSSASFSSSSSDEEFGLGKKGGGMGRSYPGRRSEAIVCNPWNTLMAVMVQMIAHRVSYAWVVKEDYGLVGIVTFTEILRQFRSVVPDSWNKQEEENSKIQ